MVGGGFGLVEPQVLRGRVCNFSHSRVDCVIRGKSSALTQPLP